MKNPRRLLAPVVLAAALGVDTASAAILELVPGADGFIRASQSAAETKNWDNVVFLVGDTSTTDELRGVLSFSLSDPALVGATINSVTLTLAINNTDTNSGSSVETLQLYALTQSFSESAVTWTSRNGTNDWSTPGGDLGPLLASATDDPDTATKGDLVVFSTPELSSSVASSIGGSLDLLVRLSATDATRSIFRFVSRNSATADIALRPSLSIDYSPAAVPEPSAFAALAAIGALGFAASRRQGRR